MIRKDAKGRTITLKVKYFDFQQITGSITVDEPAESASNIMKYIKPLLAKTEVGDKKVRLLGISISNFGDQEIKVERYRQLLLPFKFSNAKGIRNEFQPW